MLRFTTHQSKVKGRKSKASGFWADCDSGAALDLKTLRLLASASGGST